MKITREPTINRILLFGLGLASVILTAAQIQEVPLAAKDQELQVGKYRVSSPVTHKNLTVFLIHGQDRWKGRPLQTLQEAMEQKKVVVHETSDVNELAIENVSQDEVFIQSGDIVKGGKQDRVLTTELILSPKSGRVPIASFCVEQGRWRPRGMETSSRFGSSNEQLATKKLKLAAKHDSDQAEVWKQVSAAQGNLSMVVGAPVAAAQSPSSLQLTLENKKIQELAQDYLGKLSSIVEGKHDVIGYAFAINGKLNSADVYASSALFRKLWPKAIKASVIEALAEFKKDGKFEVPTREMVRDLFVDAESGKATEKEVTGRIGLVKRETSQNIMFETRDRKEDGVAIHKNYITK